MFFSDVENCQKARKPFYECVNNWYPRELKAETFAIHQKGSYWDRWERTDATDDLLHFGIEKLRSGLWETIHNFQFSNKWYFLSLYKNELIKYNEIINLLSRYSNLFWKKISYSAKHLTGYLIFCFKNLFSRDLSLSSRVSPLRVGQLNPPALCALERCARW